MSLLSSQPAWAADFDVDTTLDGVDSDLSDGICLNVTVVAGGACALRAAIQQANTTLAPDTINLPAGTYRLTIENLLDNAEDAAVTGDLDITSNVVIEGAGADVTIIEAKNDLHDRVFHLLGPLADNGGDLQTHALLEGSIAIDAGSQLATGSGGRACYATDARGQSRPARVYCDMGAFELPQSLYMPKLEK